MPKRQPITQKPSFDNSDGFFDLRPSTPRKPPKPDPRPLEDVLKKKILSLKRQGFFIARANAGTFQLDKRWIQGASKGHSDVYGYVTQNGVPMPFFIELKRFNEVPTDEQQRFLHQRASDGCIVGVVDTLCSFLALLGLEPTLAERRWDERTYGQLKRKNAN